MKANRKSRTFTLAGLAASFLFLGAINPTAHASNIKYEPTTNAEFLTVDEFLSSQKRIHKMTKTAEELAYDAKLKALSDYAKQVAMQASMHNNMKLVSDTVLANSRNLDAIYDFQPLMIHNKVVPPVVTEAVDLYNQTGAMQVRTTDRVYDIVAQARLSSTAPNWRDYLNFPRVKDAYPDYVYLTAGLKPENKIEREVWDKATREGWQMGQAQANQILLESMDRLNRDYIGMIRFHRLVDEGKLDMPALTSYDLYDNTDGVRLLMGEKLFQISSLPQFKNPSPELKKQHGSTLKKESYLVHSEPVTADEPLEVAKPKEVVELVTKAVNNKSVVDEPQFIKPKIIKTTTPIESTYIKGEVVKTFIDQSGQAKVDDNPAQPAQGE